MTNIKATMCSIANHIEGLGYSSVKVELDLRVGGYGTDNVFFRYTDLMGESHSDYTSAEEDETPDELLSRVYKKALDIPFARDALQADAAALVQRTRQKLIDAGFDKETWMAELTAIVEQLSSNAITSR